MNRRIATVSTAWLITGGSIAAVVGLILLLWQPWSGRSRAGTKLTFWCAAGMRPAVEKVIRDYEHDYDVTIQTSFQGSGALLTPVRKQQRDLYLSADRFHMNIAKNEGLVDEIIPVGYIHAVVVVNKSTYDQLEKDGKSIDCLRDLIESDLKIVMGNPGKLLDDGSPKGGTAVGRTTRKLFEAAGLWQKVETLRKQHANRISQLGTVNEVAEAVSFATDTAGIIWDATAAHFDKLVVVFEPQTQLARETMQVAVLKRTDHPTAALRFARFLTARNKGLQYFEEHHFTPVPDADVWQDPLEIRIDAGAMLKPGLEPVFKQFEEREGITIIRRYDGCGVLVAAMKKKQTFPDAYVSCDVSFADMVKSHFKAAKYLLKNRLVMLVHKGNPHNIHSLDDLKDKDLKIGVPHPVYSAMGQFLNQHFKNVGFPQEIYDPELNNKLTQANAAHTLVNQFLTGKGTYDVIIVGRSNALSTSENKDKFDIVDFAEIILRQTFSISQTTQHKYLMQRLYDAISSPSSMQRFEKLGFMLPEEK